MSVRQVMRSRGYLPTTMGSSAARPTTHRWFATTGAKSATAPATTSTTSRWTGRIAQMIRIVRIPIVVVSVYTLGYQQGVIDCTKEPKHLERQLTTGILVGTGCKDLDSTTTIATNQINWSTTAKEHRIAATVGQKIIAEALTFVQSKLHEAEQTVLSQLSPSTTPQERTVALASNEQVEFWTQALLRLEGEDGPVLSPPWQFIFCHSPSPNAFVTELLPRRFFVTTSLLELSRNSHELAVIFGHEIAHMILGHNSAQNQVEFALRTTEVLLLSIDPTAGFFSMIFMAGIYAVRKAVAAAYSRDHETAADVLGLQLAAAACFDTAAGARILETLHQQTKAPRTLAASAAAAAASSSPPTSVSAIMDSHPPTVERFQKMMAQAETENYHHHAKCMTVSRRLHSALWGP